MNRVRNDHHCRISKLQVSSSTDLCTYKYVVSEEEQTRKEQEICNLTCLPSSIIDVKRDLPASSLESDDLVADDNEWYSLIEYLNDNDNLLDHLNKSVLVPQLSPPSLSVINNEKLFADKLSAELDEAMKRATESSFHEDEPISSPKVR
jgi:hypothetical protein